MIILSIVLSFVISAITSWTIWQMLLNRTVETMKETNAKFVNDVKVSCEAVERCVGFATKSVKVYTDIAKRQAQNKNEKE